MIEKVPMADVENSIKAQKEDIMRSDVLNLLESVDHEQLG
jgi:hypothetical protein